MRVSTHTSFTGEGHEFEGDLWRDRERVREGRESKYDENILYSCMTFPQRENMEDVHLREMLVSVCSVWSVVFKLSSSLLIFIWVFFSSLKVGYSCHLPSASMLLFLQFCH